MKTLIRKLSSSVLILLGVIAMAGVVGCGAMYDNVPLPEQEQPK